jgi:hypothetical protein
VPPEQSAKRGIAEKRSVLARIAWIENETVAGSDSPTLACGYTTFGRKQTTMTIHTLEVGEGLDCEALLAALSERIEELEEIILSDMTHHDMRAVYSDDTLELEHVYEYNGAYCLCFTYGKCPCDR